jgi:hypothetical protein
MDCQWSAILSPQLTDCLVGISNPMFKPKTKKIEMLFQQWTDCLVGYCALHNELIALLALTMV